MSKQKLPQNLERRIKMKKKNVWRLVALLLCSLLVVSVVACGDDGKTDTSASDTPSSNAPSSSAPSTSAPSNSVPESHTPGSAAPVEIDRDKDSDIVSARDTLKIAARGDAGTLLRSSAGGLANCLRQVNEPLWEFDDAGNLVFVLAESVDNWGEEVMTIHLRKDVKFSNGNDFTAEDVIFTINYDKADRPGTLREYNMEKTKIIDDHTIELVLDPYGWAVHNGFAGYGIYDSKTFDEDTVVMNPVGTGPYVVTEYVINSHVYLKARDDYWGEKPKIENVHYIILNEDSQIVNALQTGAVDIVVTVPAQDIEYAQTLKGFNVRMYNHYSAPVLLFNLNPISVMNSLDARLAVCYAVNRQAILDLVYFGYGAIHYNHTTTYAVDYTPVLDDLNPVYRASPNSDIAREHAEKAGLVGKEITLITNGTPAYITIAEILQNNLSEIGITAKIVNYDAASYRTAEVDPELYDIAVSVYGSPSRTGMSVLANYVDWYPTRYKDGWDGYDEYYALAMKMMAEANATDREQEYIDLAHLFADQMLWFSLMDLYNGLAVNEDLANTGKWWSNMSIHANEWYWVK